MPDSEDLNPRSPSRRKSLRRTGEQDRRADAEARINLPAIIPGSGPTRQPVNKAGIDQLSEFAAQLIGQNGQKRGLRGGSETLDKARSSYLGAEWSGVADRRPQAGRITKTEI
jgi:hypothetical protein